MINPFKNKKGLGRGLSSLIGDSEIKVTNNKISISSPIAKALLGKKVDDLVSIRAPKGDREYMILDIEYSA